MEVDSTSFPQQQQQSVVIGYMDPLFQVELKYCSIPHILSLLNLYPHVDYPTCSRIGVISGEKCEELEVGI